MRLRELRVSYHAVAGAPTGPRRRLATPSETAAYIAPLIESEAVEVFGMLLVNTKHEPVAWHVLSRGCLDSTLVHPREVVKVACLANAAAVIVAQNQDTLLRDSPQQYLEDAKFIDLKVGAEGKTAFSHKLRADVFQARRGAYILTGGVGSGKTTFLKRFASLVEPEFVARYTAWFHIDFLAIGNVDAYQLDDELRRYVYRRIREQLAHHKSEFTSDGSQIRQLFAAEISDAQVTALYNVEEGTEHWNTRVNDLVANLYADDERYAFAALRYLRLSRGRRIAIVLDNTDQLGETFQEKVFLLAQKLAADYDAICVVTLR
jgi:hypothetical protein